MFIAAAVLSGTHSFHRVRKAILPWRVLGAWAVSRSKTFLTESDPSKSSEAQPCTEVLPCTSASTENLSCTRLGVRAPVPCKPNGFDVQGSCACMRGVLRASCGFGMLHGRPWREQTHAFFRAASGLKRHMDCSRVLGMALAVGAFQWRSLPAGHAM
jgi:hypothetical protein